MTAQTEVSKHAVAVSSPSKWLAFVLLLAGAFMALLDTTIVNIAIPVIRTSMGVSNAALAWIVSGYALAFGLALIPAGRVGDRIGHKWVFVAGLALFTFASLACGLARNDVELIVARVVQGLAGGIFFTTITALVQLEFSGRERGRAFAILGATIGFSTALGPLVGGLIIDTFGEDDGWRLIFGVNVPIGVLVVLAATVLLPRAVAAVSGSVDWLGLILLSSGLTAILVPLIEGQQRGWPWWTYVGMIGGGFLVGVFGLWERRLEHANGNPLVPPRLFSHPTFTAGVLLALVFFAAFTSIFFTIALLWQAGLGHSALQTGLVAIPFAIGTVIGAAPSETLSVRFGRTVLIAGLGLVAAGIGAVWLILAHYRAVDYNGWQLLPPLLIAGVGSGLFIAPNVDFIAAAVQRHEAGAASGVIGTAQRVGSAIGIAVISTVFFGTLHFIPGPHAAAFAFGHSATRAMGVSAALSITAFVLAFTLPKRIIVTPVSDRTSPIPRADEPVVKPDR